MSPGIVRPARRPPGWRAPGPPPAGPQGRPELAPAEGEDLCLLCGDWRLFQPQRGHRWSLDDLVTAWVATASAAEREALAVLSGALAVRPPDDAADVADAAHIVRTPDNAAHAEPAAHALDLGCGLGSVLLMVAWRWPHARVTGIEAQPARAALARRSLAYNGVDDRCRVLDGDLRTAAAHLPSGPYELVTGTPPYFPLGEGTAPRDAGAAACRFELRGGVEDYLGAAQPLLAPTGRLVVCTAALEHPRVTAAARAFGLGHVEHWDIVPRQGKPALVAVDVLRHGAAPATRVRALTVRDRAGAWTPAFREVRRAMGLPPTSPTGA